MRSPEILGRMNEGESKPVAGSFRDPAGFVFTRDDSIYRQINASYAADYRCLVESGLYRRLASAGLLVAHEECDAPPPCPDLAFKVIRPDRVRFISYPYEWCFSQLKDAALLTLEIQQAALEHGMVLKDASAYNVQFEKGRPLHIDTLSFARYHEGEPWGAYRQFCEHFLAPLALCSMTDARLGRLLSLHPDGIPLDLAAALLPAHSWLKPGIALQLNLHARFQSRHAGAAPGNRSQLSRHGMLALLDSLAGAVKGLNWKPGRTTWTDYALPEARDTLYDAEKQSAVRQCLEASRPRMVCDLGANTGTYSRIAASGAELVISVDADASVVEMQYGECRKCLTGNILPLVIDLANPSPAIGWENAEREAFLERIAPDAVLALALVHHLAIGNNLPLPRIARTLRAVCKDLIIEFVSENDSRARGLIEARCGQIHPYSRAVFEAAFGEWFETVATFRLRGEERLLYHFRSREGLSA